MMMMMMLIPAGWKETWHGKDDHDCNEDMTSNENYFLKNTHHEHVSRCIPRLQMTHGLYRYRKFLSPFCVFRFKNTDGNKTIEATVGKDEGFVYFGMAYTWGKELMRKVVLSTEISSFVVCPLLCCVRQFGEIMSWLYVIAGETQRKCPFFQSVFFEYICKRRRDENPRCEFPPSSWLSARTK